MLPENQLGNSGGGQHFWNLTFNNQNFIPDQPVIFPKGTFTRLKFIRMIRYRIESIKKFIACIKQPVRKVSNDDHGNRNEENPHPRRPKINIM